MMLRVNNILYKPEAVRCYWLLYYLTKNAVNYSVLSLHVINFIIRTIITYIIIIHNIIINGDERPHFAAHISHGHAKEFVRK